MIDFLRHPLVAVVILLPTLGAIVALCARHRAIRVSALAAALLTVAASLLLPFDPHVTGLGSGLMIVTAIVGAAACFASPKAHPHSKIHFALLLLAQSAALATFTCDHLRAFAIFFPLPLLPLYFLIGLGGGRGRFSAATGFLLNGAVAAALLAIVAVDPLKQGWGFWLLVAAMLLRLGAWPLHGWVVEAHRAGDRPLRMALFGFYQAAGGYGLCRFGWIHWPMLFRQHWMALAVIGLTGAGFCALIGIAQTDRRRLLALGGVAQSGWIVLGLAVLTPIAFSGAMLLLLAQSLGGAMLQIAADWPDPARPSRSGGGAVLSLVVYFGCPGFLEFVGELLVLIGIFAAAEPGAPFHQQAVVLNCLGILAAMTGVLRGGELLRVAALAPTESREPRDKWTFAVLAMVLLALGALPWLCSLLFMQPTGVQIP